MDLTLLVLAAGMGSRFGGLKQMEPIGPGGEVLLDYSVYDAIRAGFTKAVFVIRREMEETFCERLSSKFADRIEVAFAFQELTDLPEGFALPAGRSKPWGTGHAVLAARNLIESPFLAVNADDFYGAPAYRLIAEFLRQQEQSTRNLPEYAMVGYRLADTLSDSGSVSRGLCRGSSDGRLTAITELTNIERVDGALANREPGAPPLGLSGEETVSMNFWGFTPSFFPLLEKGFARFLDSLPSGADGEFYLPYAVTDLISSGAAVTRLIPGGGTWFGITYPADRAPVEQAIRRLVEAGEYPSQLWGG